MSFVVPYCLIVLNTAFVVEMQRKILTTIKSDCTKSIRKSGNPFIDKLENVDRSQFVLYFYHTDQMVQMVLPPYY